MDLEEDDVDDVDDAAEAVGIGEATAPPVNRASGAHPRRRERRVSISEARALLERGQRLHDRMSAEDREEAVTLRQTIEQAISGADWEQLRAATADLADLLFYVEEG